MNKEERINVVNQIITKIALTGRRFFFNKSGKIAELFIRNNKLWYKCEWVSDKNPVKEICLSVPRNNYKGFYHGGTLKSLITEFKRFIQTGDYHDPDYNDNDYSGLYCIHWGYSEKDMEEIRKFAKELKYLKND